MWRRLRRRTLTPSRPAVFADQVGLVVLTVVVVLGGLYVVFRVLTG